MKSYYEILEVEPDATPGQIREQYLFLIQAWHPDKFPNAAQKAKAEEKTKAINAAFEVLRHSVKRAEYDRSTRFSQPNQKQESPRREEAQPVGRRADTERPQPKAEPLGKERAGGKRTASALT